MSRLLQSPAALKRPAPPSVSETFSHFQEEQQCGRPFCKLKRRDHFHCELCNQAFSEADRLRPHLERHAEGWQAPQTGVGVGVGAGVLAGAGAGVIAMQPPKQEQRSEEQQQEDQEREQRRSKYFKS